MTGRNDATPAERRRLKAMLDAFRWLGPVEALDWLATYFEGYSAGMRHHAHPAPWCDDLVAELRALVRKYRELSR